MRQLHLAVCVLTTPATRLVARRPATRPPYLINHSISPCISRLSSGFGLLLLAHSLACSQPVAVPESRFFTTTGVSLAFPVGALRAAATNGRGTTVNMEYRITRRFSLMGAWDSNTLPVQSTALVANLGPVLQATVAKLKGDYISNAVGLYGLWYLNQHKVKPYLVGGAGLNIVSVPIPVFDPTTKLLSLESAVYPTFFAQAGLGLNWQFSKPIALFAETTILFVPAGSPVSAGGNSLINAKIGLQFPLF